MATQLRKRNNSTKQRTAQLVGQYARSKAKKSLEMINAFREDPKVPITVRMKCAEIILERGLGKATQHTESQVEVNVQALHLHAVKDAAAMRLTGPKHKLTLVDNPTEDTIDVTPDDEELA